MVLLWPCRIASEWFGSSTHLEILKSSVHMMINPGINIMPINPGILKGNPVAQRTAPSLVLPRRSRDCIDALQRAERQKEDFFFDGKISSQKIENEPKITKI